MIDKSLSVVAFRLDDAASLTVPELLDVLPSNIAEIDVQFIGKCREIPKHIAHLFDQFELLFGVQFVRVSDPFIAPMLSDLLCDLTGFSVEL